MSKIEDFEDAPIGATATYLDGSRAMKMGDGEWGWVTPACHYYNDEEMEYWGYTLDPIEPAPTTAFEALELAWELAHPVKEGQIIPEGDRYLAFSGFGLKEYTAQRDIKIDSELLSMTRTVKPLSDPEPEWLDAPAVLASKGEVCPWKKVWLPRSDGKWTCTCCGAILHWSLMIDVTPLWPKED